MYYRQITREQRYALALGRQAGWSVRAIARHLGRAPSTITRELRRNQSRDGAYRPLLAQRQAQNCRHQGRRRWWFAEADWVLILTLLQEGLSPEQITGRLAREGAPDQPRDHLPVHLAQSSARRRPVALAPRGAQEEAQARREL